MLFAKIISGGQTGVDRGAIAAARDAGFPYGGLIPKGRLAEDGIVPEIFDKMEVAPRKEILARRATCDERRVACWRGLARRATCDERRVAG